MINFVFDGNDTIPVFKLFFKNYLPSASANDIKVYLYGLFLASEKKSVDVESLAEKLDLTTAEVERAISGWIQVGFIVKKGDIYKFTLPPETLENDTYLSDMFVDNISRLMRGRDFMPSEANDLLEMRNIYHLPEEVIYMLIEYYSSPEVKGKRVSVRYLTRVAEKWANNDIRTPREAEMEINRQKALSSGMFKVISALYGGNRRAPNDQELALYVKWTKDYGFSLDAIMQVVGDASLLQEPSVKYLDAMLTNYYEKGIISSSEIAAKKEVFQKRKDELKSVLDALKSPRKNVSETLQGLYDDWMKLGFSHVAVLCACEYTLNSGYHSYKKVDELLKHCHKQGIINDKAVADALKFRSSDDIVIHQILEVAGITGNITERDRKMFYDVTEKFGLSIDLIKLAADQSRLKTDPRGYMYSVLKAWSESGISSVKEALRYGSSFSKKAGFNDVKNNRKTEDIMTDDGDKIYR